MGVTDQSTGPCDWSFISHFPSDCHQPQPTTLHQLMNTNFTLMVGGCQMFMNKSQTCMTGPWSYTVTVIVTDPKLKKQTIAQWADKSFFFTMLAVGENASWSSLPCLNWTLTVCVSGSIHKELQFCVLHDRILSRELKPRQISAPFKSLKFIVLTGLRENKILKIFSRYKIVQ